MAKNTPREVQRLRRVNQTLLTEKRHQKELIDMQDDALMQSNASYERLQRTTLCLGAVCVGSIFLYLTEVL